MIYQILKPKQHNIPYITETRVLKLLFKIIHTYEYYYTYVSYYDDVVSEKYVLKNDIQSVIYLVIPVYTMTIFIPAIQQLI